MLNDIAMHAVDSTAIVELGFDAEKKRLAVRFRSRKLYHYSNVPQEIYDNLRNAPSMGRFFGQYVEGKFPALHIDEIPPKPEDTQ